MTVNEEWFTTMPFEYEQQSWRLVGRLSLRGMTVFEYDDAEPSVVSGVVKVLRIMWDGTSEGFSDERATRPKTPREAFADGIEWAAIVADAHGHNEAAVEIWGTVERAVRVFDGEGKART